MIRASCQVATFTFNPALDLWTQTDALLPSHKLRCDVPQVHPGGGGINVARVLHRLGLSCTAWFPYGGATGQQLLSLLQAEGVACAAHPVPGDTRQSFTVRERAQGQEYRFVLPGLALRASDVRAACDWLSELPAAPSWAVLSGSLPPEVEAADVLRRWKSACAARGVCTAVDASGNALRAALELGVDLVKPSWRELSECAGRALETPADAVGVARDLVRARRARWVAVSLGADGAALVGESGAWQAPALAATVTSTVGAGDSFLAGLLWQLAQGASPAQALRAALAAGAAALTQAGTALADAQAVVQRMGEVQICFLEE